MHWIGLPFPSPQPRSWFSETTHNGNSPAPPWQSFMLLRDRPQQPSSDLCYSCLPPGGHFSKQFAVIPKICLDWGSGTRGSPRKENQCYSREQLLKMGKKWLLHFQFTSGLGFSLIIEGGSKETSYPVKGISSWMRARVCHILEPGEAILNPDPSTP